MIDTCACLAQQCLFVLPQALIFLVHIKVLGDGLLLGHLVAWCIFRSVVVHLCFLLLYCSLL